VRAKSGPMLILGAFLRSEGGVADNPGCVGTCESPVEANGPGGRTRTGVGQGDGASIVGAWECSRMDGLSVSLCGAGPAFNVHEPGDGRVEEERALDCVGPGGMG